MNTEAFGGSGNRIPVGARLSSLVQMGPEAHPAFCKMDLFLGVKWPQRGVDSSLLPNADNKERVELQSKLPLGLHGLLYAEIYLYLLSCCKKIAPPYNVVQHNMLKCCSVKDLSSLFCAL